MQVHWFAGAVRPGELATGEVLVCESSFESSRMAGAWTSLRPVLVRGAREEVGYSVDVLEKGIFGRSDVKSPPSKSVIFIIDFSGIILFVQRKIGAAG